MSESNGNGRKLFSWSEIQNLVSVGRNNEGTIVQYSPQKGFGLLVRENQPKRTIFFHCNQGISISFNGGDTPRIQEGYTFGKFPFYIGDKLLFIEEDHDGKLRAKVWYNPTQIKAVAQKIEERPTIRVRERKGFLPKGKLHRGLLTFTTLTETNNVGEALNRYADLESTSDYYALWFERKIPGNPSNREWQLVTVDELVEYMDNLRFFCPNCGSSGFDRSESQDGCCTFCDGTEGGQEPEKMFEKVCQPVS